MRRLIRGKFDSRWKKMYTVAGVTLRLGHFSGAMDYARRNKTGIWGIHHIRSQPWESWQNYNKKIG